MTTRTLDVDLLRAVRNGGKSVWKKKTLPILTCLLLRQNGERLEVVSNDLSTFSRDSVQCSGSAIEYAVPAKPLTDWLRALEPKKKNPGVIELEVIQPANPYPNAGPNLHWDKRSYLQVKAGNIKAKFFGMDAQEFPITNLSRFEGPVDREPIENGA